MMNTKILVTLAVIASIINACLAGQYGGFEQGYFYTRALYKECVGMGVSGGTAYGELADCHVFILLSIMLFIVCKLLSTGRLSQAICLCLSALALFKTVRWYLALEHIGESYSDPFYDLLRETVILGWLSAVLIIFLFVFQIYSLWLSHNEGESATT